MISLSDVSPAPSPRSTPPSSAFPSPGRGEAQPSIYDSIEAQDRETLRLRSVVQRSLGVGRGSGSNPLTVRLPEEALAISIPTIEMRSAPARVRRQSSIKRDSVAKEKLYVVYIIELQRGDVKWRLGRRFSEFYTLNKLLRRALGKRVKLPRLPPKRVKVGSSKFDPKFTLMRRERLETYLQELSALFDSSTVMADALDDFLEYSENMILASVRALRALNHAGTTDSLQSSRTATMSTTR